MSDPFESPKILLNRAHERTRDLDNRLKAFIAQKPYAHIIEPDGDDGMEAHKFKVTQGVPSAARADAFEIGNSLRSSLDQAVFGASVAINGGHPKSTKFPFGDTITDVENDIKRGCRDVPADIVTLLRRFKPYQGGNDALWALNKMRNTKNHQILLPMAFASGGTAIGMTNVTISGTAEIGMNRWDADKQEVTYMRTLIGHRPQGNYQARAAINVVIGDVPVLAGNPAVGVFNHLCGEVQRIVLGIEAETARILRERGT